MIKVSPIVGYDVGGHALCLDCLGLNPPARVRRVLPSGARPLFAPFVRAQLRACACCETELDAVPVRLPSMADVRPDCVGRR